MLAYLINLLAYLLAYLLVYLVAYLLTHFTDLLHTAQVALCAQCDGRLSETEFTLDEDGTEEVEDERPRRVPRQQLERWPARGCRHPKDIAYISCADPNIEPGLGDISPRRKVVNLGT